MNVKIGAEAAIFPEKEYINGIAVAVHIFRQGGQHVVQLCRFSPTLLRSQKRLSRSRKRLSLKTNHAIGQVWQKGGSLMSLGGMWPSSSKGTRAGWNHVLHCSNMKSPLRNTFIARWVGESMTLQLGESGSRCLLARWLGELMSEYFP